MQVRARHATLSGLPPWGRSRRWPIGLRVCLFALSAGFSAYLVGRLSALRPGLPVWAGALLGVCVSGCLWWAVSWLERQEPHGVAYLVLPAAGALGATLCGLSLLLAQRIRGRRGASPIGSARP